MAIAVAAMPVSLALVVKSTIVLRSETRAKKIKYNAAARARLCFRGGSCIVSNVSVF